MTLAVEGSTATAWSSPNRAPGAGVLRVQLDRYERQLSDWCRCPSGKSAEGKRIIAALQVKADSLREQIRKIDEAGAVRAGAGATGAKAGQPVATPTTAPTRSLIDTYA